MRRQSAPLLVRSTSGSCRLAVLAMMCAGLLPCPAWRPSLYPENWTPPEDGSFATAKLIQDFSYAGYRRGEEPIPDIAAPVFDVTTFGADPNGVNDSTVPIQDAIDAAATAGGGVVFLPAGTYRVAPQANNIFTLRIQSSGIVLRGAGAGQTYLLNTSHQMRGTSVIRVAAPSTSSGPAVAITADMDTPTRRIPVANAAAFQTGDIIRIEWEFTQGWIDEHGQGTWWSEPDVAPAPARYFREITAVNPAEDWIEVDVPIRYTIRTRDNPLVQTVSGMITGVGVEDISIGNVQHPGSGFGEGDYAVEGTAAYDAHASYLVRMQDTVDGWITGVHSFQPAVNTTTCHMLSNGIILLRCFRVTVGDCEMRRAQYGGGGGNAYMYRVQSSNECLVRDSVADFSRHGFVVSHAGTSGNVFLRCEDRETQRSTGDATDGLGYTTGGSGSDQHMHFSHSNLFDQCHAHNSFFTAHHRRFSGTIPHGLTSAHSVYWNTSGSGSRGGAVVRSEQARYGYVIGTSGSRNTASNPTGGNTAPADHLEGIGQGATMDVPSLYLDQLAKRMQGILVDAGGDRFTEPGTALPLAGSVYTYGSDPVTSLWTQISGPATAVFADASLPATTVDLPQAGTYVFELAATDGNNSASAQVAIEAGISVLQSAAQFIRGKTQDPVSQPLGYFTSASDVIGTQGTNGSRDDRNVVLGYNLPALPEGSTLESATFAFEITAARDTTGPANLPELHVYLLDSENPADSGTGFFYHGPLDASPDVRLVGTSSVAIGGTSENVFGAGGQTRFFTLTGDALALLQSYYDGHVPSRSTVYFRFNLSVDPSMGDLRRYRVNAETDGSFLHLLPTAPPATYSVSYDDNQATDGTAPVDQTKIQDIDLILATNIGGLVRAGHVFLGWNTAADGSGTDYAEGATYTENAPLALFAKWNAHPSVSAGPDQVITLPPVLWTPEKISTAAWYDASEAANLTIQDENTVSEWRDNSGNGNHAAQDNAAVRPTTGSATIGGRPAVSFRVGDGSNKQFLSAPDHPSLNLDSSGGSNVFAVMRYLGFVENGSTGLNAALTKGQLLFNQSAYGIRVSNANNLGYHAGSNAQISTQDFSNQPILYAGTGDFAAGSTRIFVNGQLRNSHTAGESVTSDNTAPLHIGRDDSNGRYADVDFGEILVLGGVPDDGGRQMIEGYLAHKWGMAGELPADHPYKDAPPMIPGTSATASLAGSASDADNDPLSIAWSVVSGPGDVIFSDPSTPETSATFSKAGDYVLRLTVNDGWSTAFDEVVITVVVPSYSVTYDGNGSTDGTVPVDSTEYESLATVTVLGPGDLVKDGHIFAGWNTAADGSGTSRAPGSAFPITADTTLHARWTPKMTPSVDPWPTATPITEGQALASSSLEHGDASVPGNFAFADPSIVPPAGIHPAEVIFTPNDTASYHSVQGIVNVTVQTLFESWAGSGDITFAGDANGDGIANGMAWLLGAGEPGENARALLPVAIENNGALETNFAMLNQAARGAAVLNLQYGTDLETWTTIAIPEASGTHGGVEFVITPDGSLNQVVATIPASAAPDGRLFIRLSGSEN